MHQHATAHRAFTLICTHNIISIYATREIPYKFLLLIQLT